MAQQLLVKLIDNTVKDEDRTPFLMLWQPWGGYTISALETVNGILKVIDEKKYDIFEIMKKPNHRYELADLLVDALHSHKPEWMPMCGKEIAEYGITISDGREKYCQMTKLLFMANKMKKSASLINKETVWDPAGILVPLEVTIDKMLADEVFKDDLWDVEIGIDTDGTPWTIFRAMEVYEADDDDIKKYTKDDLVFCVRSTVKQYVEEMSIEKWQEFYETMNLVDEKCKCYLISKADNIVIKLL